MTHNEGRDWGGVGILEELRSREFPPRSRTIVFPPTAQGTLWRTDIYRPEGRSWMLQSDEEDGSWIGPAQGTISSDKGCLMLEIQDSELGLSWLRELNPDDIDVLSAGERRIPLRSSPTSLASAG